MIRPSLYILIISTASICFSFLFFVISRKQKAAAKPVTFVEEQVEPLRMSGGQHSHGRAQHCALSAPSKSSESKSKLSLNFTSEDLATFRNSGDKSVFIPVPLFYLLPEGEDGDDMDDGDDDEQEFFQDFDAQKTFPEALNDHDDDELVDEDGKESEALSLEHGISVLRPRANSMHGLLQIGGIGSGQSSAVDGSASKSEPQSDVKVKLVKPSSVTGT